MTDSRDDHLAERLHVDPLDEVTRARLVRTAMAAVEADAAEAAEEPAPNASAVVVASSRWSARTRVLGIAAALLVVLAVGFAVFVRDDSTPSSTTAARAPKAADQEREVDQGAAAPSAVGDSEASAFSVSLTPLGDLGDVTARAALRRAVTAALPTGETSQGSSDSKALGTTALPDGVPRELQPACPAARVDRLGELVAVGTGTVRGEAVTVYVVDRPNGKRAAVAIGPDCTVGEPVPL